MSWYRHHWWNVGRLVAFAAAVVLATTWGSLDGMQRILLGSFIVLLLHEFEEWGWPGGEPRILNTVLPGFGPISRAIGAGSVNANPDRYPSNANSAMVVNVFAAYPIYILAAIFSRAIWLGLFAAFFFWIGQLIFHGVITTSQLRYPYNPGLVTPVIGVALAVYYVNYVSHHHLTSVWDSVAAVALLPVLP